MSTHRFAHMIAGAQVGVPSPERWFDVWGDPVPRHAGAALKPAPGREKGYPGIWSLHVHDDRHVLVGFGDANINDGDTPLVSFDPVTGESEIHGIYPTEAFTTFRKFNDVSYALFIDGTGYWEWMRPYATFPTSAPQPSPIDAIHIFDMTQYNNRLWVGGSCHSGTGSGVAAIWWSEDKGTTWNKTVPTGIVGDYERVYYLEVINGRLYSRINSMVLGKTQGGLDCYVWDDESNEWKLTDYPGTEESDEIVCPYPLPPYGVVTAKTSTHWILGTEMGDLYTIPIEENK